MADRLVSWFADIAASSVAQKATDRAVDPATGQQLGDAALQKTISGSLGTNPKVVALKFAALVGMGGLFKSGVATDVARASTTAPAASETKQNGAGLALGGAAALGGAGLVGLAALAMTRRPQAALQTMNTIRGVGAGATRPMTAAATASIGRTAPSAFLNQGARAMASRSGGVATSAGKTAPAAGAGRKAAAAPAATTRSTYSTVDGRTVQATEKQAAAWGARRATKGGR